MTTELQHRSIRPPRQYFDAIRRSDRFLEEKSKSRDSDSERRAIGATALHFVAGREAVSKYLDLDVQAIRLIGLLDDFVTAEHGMQDIKARVRDGERVKRSERIPHLTEVIKFNHAFRDLIDTNQGLTVAEIERFIGAATLEMFDSKQERDFVLNELRLITIGMQHEIVAEQALWTIDGVEDVIHADIEDEMVGIDLKVVYNGTVVNLDIKSSQRTAEAAQLKSRGSNTQIVWSGVNTHELNGKFRAEPNKVADAADYLQNVLDGAQSLPLAL